MNIEAFEGLIESSLNSGCGGLYICASEARDLIALVRTAEQERDQYKFWYENETMKFVAAADEISVLRRDIESIRAQLQESAALVLQWQAEENLKHQELEKLRAQIKEAQEQKPHCWLVGSVAWFSLEMAEHRAKGARLVAGGDQTVIPLYAEPVIPKT